MFFRLAAFLPLICAASLLFGQRVSPLIGGRAMGLAYATAALEDEWAILNNPAGLASLHEIQSGFAYHKLPALPGANRIAGQFSIPAGSGAFGAGVFRFGDDLYNEQALSLGYGNRLGIASLGVRLDAIQLRTEGFATTLSWGLTLGGVAHITEKFLVGAVVNNLNQPRLPDGEYLPVKMRVSPTLRPTEKLYVIAEIEKDLAYPPTWKGAIEYQIHKKVFARTGFNLQPDHAFWGVGFICWKMKVDYAMQYSRLLNFGHQASVVLRWPQKKKDA